MTLYIHKFLKDNRPPRAHPEKLLVVQITICPGWKMSSRKLRLRQADHRNSTCTLKIFCYITTKKIDCLRDTIKLALTLVYFTQRTEGSYSPINMAVPYPVTNTIQAHSTRPLVISI